MAKQLAKRLVSLCIWKKKTFYIIILAIKFYYDGKKERRISITMNKNMVKSDVVKHELQVESL